MERPTSSLEDLIQKLQNPSTEEEAQIWLRIFFLYENYNNWMRSLIEWNAEFIQVNTNKKEKER